MNRHKFLFTLVSLLAAAAILIGSSGAVTAQPLAMPMDPVDESKVPHYFGPYPNWAMSPFRVPNVFIEIAAPADPNGVRAEAAATVDPQTGAITDIIVTSPGSGYSSPPLVTITGSGINAAADAVMNFSGIVTGITLDPGKGGGGYTAPTVVISGGGAVTDATATAYGGVDNAALISGTDYSGYTMPIVEFGLPNDPAGIQATGHATCVEDINCTPAGGGLVTVNGIVVVTAGSGYSAAPSVIIRDGPAGAPVSSLQNPATATLTIQSFVVNTFGSGYTSAPTVTIKDTLPGTGNGAAATATVSIAGSASVTGFIITNHGSGYMTPGIKKFTDALPGLCDPAVAGSCSGDKYIPLAVGQVVTYTTSTGIQVADQYEIAVMQYRTSFSSSLPDTLVRGYVELAGPMLADKSCTLGVPLFNAPLDPLGTPVSTGYCGVTPPQYLGPVIAATKNKPVRIIFRNLLPNGVAGNLFLPVDTTLMGSGMGPMDMGQPMDMGTVMDEVRNPMCTDDPQAKDGMGMDACFKNNRATLHLHGGISPWISDGTVHQWITPANEMATWPQGVSVGNVPDMAAAGCDAKDDGCMTFYYTNQQSARLMFYHDHSWGITRLNVYAGEAAGYLITDDTEKKLLPATPDNLTGLGLIPGAADMIPLVIQDKTFVPGDLQLSQQDPTWDKTRWGGEGNLWYHHVYMPAQNPGDPGGMSAYGRWMYGPWFWPPAANTIHGPIPNPYFAKDAAGNPTCNLDDPTTYQYTVEPFCEPQFIPGTPNISVGMEQFNDTPVVNGVAYPTTTVQPKAYRLRILSAANDRFFNFQWYVADPSTGTASEVAFNEAELAAAQTDPNVFPTPDISSDNGTDPSFSLPGPDWIQIGTEGGFLPAPVVVDGQQVTTWITDPTRFDVGNVDQHSLLLAPAERADVIVDFSQFAGQTLILYNDAPAAFPARVPSYDYYTGAPDLSPNGAPTIVPGYGPNTRTIMRVVVESNVPGSPPPTPADAFDIPGTTADRLGNLEAAFAHNGTDKGGVFEWGQHPIIVGQAAYNSAYGSSFAAGSDCNAPGSTVQRCDGFVRVNDTQVFGFNTILGQNTKMTLPLQPKAIHDEMNASTFDEFGRMQANLGVEAQPPVPGAQNVVLYPFVNPATELIDATFLPKASLTYSTTTGLPVSDFSIDPISDPGDGTQIWRITHNGVDTHPIHFHLYDVQVVNRVTWDNIIIPPDLTELGWKDTVRIAPLEDTIVALRPIIPLLPWELSNSIHNLSPMMPTGSTAMFNNVDPGGNPTINPIVNQLVNFGWEYVYHCHILSHEEMDMMRPVSVAMPPIRPDGLTSVLTGSGGNTRIRLDWSDNSINETAFVIQSMDWLGVWTDVGVMLSPLDQANTHQARSFTVPSYSPNAGYRFRVMAQNTVGYGAEFPTVTAKSMSDVVPWGNPPATPSNLALTLQAGPQVRLTWRDNATNEGGFVIERSTVGLGGPFVQIATVPARNSTGNVTFTDTTVKEATSDVTYWYRVAAVNPINFGAPTYSDTQVIVVTLPTRPANPTSLTAVLQAGPQTMLTWKDNATTESGFRIERSINGGGFTLLATAPAFAGTGTVTFVDTTVTNSSADVIYSYRVWATNSVGDSLAPTNTAPVTVPALPLAPSSLTAVNGPNANKNRSVILVWNDNSNNETGFTIQRATNSLFTLGLTSVTVPASTTTYTVTGLSRSTQYWFRIRSNNGTFVFSVWANATPFPIRTNP